MVFLLLSITCSAVIMLIFKAYEIYKIDNFQAIVVNYLTCFSIGLLTVESDILAGQFWQQSWFPFAVVLGFVFIVSFQLIALTTQKSGVTVATIATKTTMVIPVTVAFFMYGDVVTFPKITGILLAVAAIFLTAIKDKQELGMDTQEERPANELSNPTMGSQTAIEANKQKSLIDGFANHSWAFILLPLSVFLSGGFIEVVINYVQVNYLEEKSANAFSMFIFTTAGVLGIFTLLFQYFTQQKKFAFKSLLAGVCLGIPNYGSIYFLIMALHSSGLESSEVFPLNNIGIVLLASFSAFWLFGERLSKMNILGVVCAVLAIVLIAL